MRWGRVLRVAAAVAAGLLFVLSGSLAQPIRDKILTYLSVGGNIECTVIRVGFSFPVRYVRHFPPEVGDELRIQLKPIAIGRVEQEGLFRRESLRPPEAEGAVLVEATYEGDIVGGPFLTLNFRNSVSYKVAQGSDYRSLIVSVIAPGAEAACDSALVGQ